MANKIPSKARPLPPPKLPKPKIQQSRVQSTSPLSAGDQYESIVPLTDTKNQQKQYQVASTVPHATEPLYQQVESMEGCLSLAEVAEKHSQDLPIVVQIKCSLYGVCDTLSLVERELLNLHFLKETKCVQILVSSGKEYSVPIDSTLQFSPVHEAVENLDITKQESVFSSVEELMSSKPLPPAVCILHLSRDASARVAVGDILLPKTVKRKAFGDGHLLCYNTANSEEVTLSGKSKIEFSTNPQWLKLYLPQFLHHVKLPLKTVITFSNIHQENALGRIFRDPSCTLASMCTELSFIVTFTRRNMDRTLIELPTTADIKVSVQKLADIAKRQLVDETHDISKNFDQRRVGAYISTDEEHSQADLHLRTFVHQGSLLPKEKPEFRKNEEFAKCSTSPELTENYYDYVEFTPRPVQQSTKLATKSAQESSPSEDTPGHVALVSTFLKKHVKLKGKKADPTTKQQAKLTTTGSCKKSDTESHDTTTDDCSSNVSGTGEVPKPTVASVDSEEVNKTFLKSLNCEEVQKVLDGMKLGMYKEVFMNEGITGDLLLELDDNILEHELGMVSRLHRIKLLKIITGQYPVQPFLDRK